MTNFDFLKKDKKFESFADVAIAAEKTFTIDPDTSAINCRRAMEFAIKWMYSVDSSLKKPWDDRLSCLMNTAEFRDNIDQNIYKRLDYIRTTGNVSVHDNKKRVSPDQAMLCLENLYIFMDFIAYCYADTYTEGKFDPELVLNPSDKQVKISETELKLEQLLKENAKLREEMTSRSEEKRKTYTPKPLEDSEYETRKLYIDTMLQNVGWVEGKNWINEYKILGMPNKSEIGYADYALFGDDGRVLAIIEAKRTCKDVAVGRQQAKLYADLIEERQGRRPVIFLSNGFETRIIDNMYNERICSSVYSKRDLEKLFNLYTMRSSLKYAAVDKNIAGRYYQEAAIKSVCDAFDNENRRKALLVMATGSGKTRTVIALCKVLREFGWVKNILFLADRTSLVTQAKRSFVNFLPDLSVTNLCEDKENYNAHCVFSTYQTMINCIDSVEGDEGKLYSCGHFDLIICDEAHRSIYNKYKDIFTYFDSFLVGLTATPKDEVDKNTYDIFNLQNGIPTYGYELAQAVKDGYLVDFMSVESKLKFPTEGIIYDELSEEDKKQYEDTFADDEDEMPEYINASAVNEWVFNRDTVVKVLDALMTYGLKVDYGNKIGKTIIFAKSHNHAEFIYKVFCEEYPKLVNYAKVIDNKINYAQSAIDEFSDPKKLPQIAISVDMLDTGIDVPEILNLVFFKKVMSKAKFWQMIGRGTRLCPGLLDGEDKKKFYIFDFCGNFEFFRMNPGKESEIVTSLQGKIFQLEFEIAYKLQDLEYQTECLIEFRKFLVEHMVTKVRELNRDSFTVRQHLKEVEKYSNEESYQTISYGDPEEIKNEIVPLVIPDDYDALAIRFDALMYGIELAYLMGKKYNKARAELVKKAIALSGIANIPAVNEQSELISSIIHSDYLDRAGVNEFENIRNKLRDLIKYIPKGNTAIYYPDLKDEMSEFELHESYLENTYLERYREKAEFYVRHHQDNEVIQKLRTNMPLNSFDIKELEKILWSEVGTKEEYNEEFGEKPLGEFVREIVGLDMNAAKAAFSEYLDSNSNKLDSRQIYFVNQIVEYIVQNGMMKDLSVLQDTPFTDQGSIIDIFTDINVWNGIRSIIQKINENAVAA